eukprot:TRINITY_DN30244_c0_g1_i1.p1 TRINITY_DN30244_c0_g1~~TRINITY_DN30244_c0_g1_i1.p1  ORF type:complete len:329 (+),score=63.83 TRINITY_DN30244_c0_g1_i1:111-1097(+)
MMYAPPGVQGMQPGVVLQPTGMPGMHSYGAVHGMEAGSVPFAAKPSPFARGAGGVRRPVNAAALVTAVLVPWFLFTFLMASLSFGVHYNSPGTCQGIVVVGFGVAVFFGYSAALLFRRGDPGFTWYAFLCFTCLVAAIASCLLGLQNYYSHMRPYFDIINLSTYPNVDPSMTKGQQLMDMGSVEFAEGSHLELTQSMGFRNSDVYCVAPIVNGNMTAEKSFYDFWAVGINCCSGHLADFGCGEFNNPKALSGLRLMRDDLRPFFRLAVEQAESAYNIKSRHPIFVYWMQNPSAEVASYADDGYKRWLVSMAIAFGVQLALVAVCVSKL